MIFCQKPETVEKKFLLNFSLHAIASVLFLFVGTMTAVATTSSTAITATRHTIARIRFAIRRTTTTTTTTTTRTYTAIAAGSATTAAPIA